MSPTRPGRGERSTSRFAGVSRTGLRVAVLAGFAGTVWALSASAAHAAADAPATGHRTLPATDTAPLDASLTSLVGDLGGSTLGSLLGTAPATGAESSAKPPAAHRSSAITDTVLAPLGHAVATTAKPLLDLGSGVLGEVLAPTSSVLSEHGAVAGTGSAAAPSRAKTPDAHVASPAAGHASGVVFGALTSLVNSPATAGPNGVASSVAPGAGSQDLVRMITSLVAPLGLDELVQAPLDEIQPMIGIADPVLAPVVDALSPLTRFVCSVTDPVFDVLGSFTRPVTDVVMRSTVEPLLTAPAGSETPSAGTPVPSASTAKAAAIWSAPVRVEADPTGAKSLSSHGPASHRRGAALHHRSHINAVDQDEAPGMPAPFQVPAGAAGGISTTGSGSHEGSSGYAVLSTPVVNGSATSAGLLTAPGHTVRSQYVESPTVSPD